MNRNQKLNLADLRLEAGYNGASIEALKHYADNMIVTTTKHGLDFVDDGAHGYLLVPITHPKYEIAHAMYIKGSNYNYKLLDGTICLEEDIEAGKFEALIDAPVPGKTYALTGGKGTPAISNGNTWAESEIKV